jgi:hypothetical protein
MVVDDVPVELPETDGRLPLGERLTHTVEINPVRTVVKFYILVWPQCNIQAWRPHSITLSSAPGTGSAHCRGSLTPGQSTGGRAGSPVWVRSDANGDVNDVPVEFDRHPGSQRTEAVINMLVLVGTADFVCTRMICAPGLSVVHVGAAERVSSGAPRL